MSIDISHETEVWLTDEARRQGVSVDALLERLMSERGAAAHVVAGNGSAPKVPILHMGAMGPLHRRDIYDDVGCRGYSMQTFWPTLSTQTHRSTHPPALCLTPPTILL